MIESNSPNAQPRKGRKVVLLGQYPNKMFKYYPENLNSLNALCNTYFWCTSPLLQNDLNDCLAYTNVKVSKASLNIMYNEFEKPIISAGKYKNFKIAKISDEGYGEMLAKTKTTILSALKCSCFSENLLNPLMWSHYASQHRGFALEFQEIKNIFYRNFITEMQYSKNKRTFPVREILSVHKDLSGNTSKSARSWYTLLKYLSHKDRYWKYEQEWRLWTLKDNKVQFPKDSIKAIYFGARCDSDYIKTTLTILESLNITYKAWQMAITDGKLQPYPLNIIIDK
jgi:hypothetical protein